MNMILVDTHTHLYAKEFDEDRDAAMQRAQALGIERLYLPNINSKSIPYMLELEAKYPERCFAMMGLHPCYVKEDYKAELDVVHGWLEQRPFVAIGEIGMDLYWDKTFVAEQKDAFRTQIGWARAYDVPFVIHARDALDELIAIVREEQQGDLRGVFHCFTGTIDQAAAIVDLGFMIGLGGVLTFKNAGLDQVAATIPLSHIVLETDAPYLAPKPHRGKRNETAYLTYVAEKLAEVKGCALAEIAQQTTYNANVLFGYNK